MGFHFYRVLRALRLVWPVVGLICISPQSAAAQYEESAPLSPVAWNGVYVGGHAGFGTADFDGIFDSSEIFFDPRDLFGSVAGGFFDLSSAAGGAQFGLQRTYGRAVFGIEADWSYLGWSDRVFDPEDEGPGGTTTDNASVDVNWLASLRARLGITSSQTLLYATAGIAWVDADYTVRDADNGAVVANSTDLNGLGFVLGGGIEHALTRDVSIRLEGLYYSFNNRRDTGSLNVDSDTGDFAVLEDIMIGRLGLNYALFTGPDQTRVQAAPPFIWDGLYLGGHLGFGLVGFDSVFDSSEIDNPFDHEDSVLGQFFDLDGALGGGYFGYSYMLGRYLVGVEADWSHLGQSDVLFDPDFSGFTQDSASVNINWIASVRGRFGVSSAQTLLYGTAGAAWVDADYTANDDDGASVGTTRISDIGFVFGGGIEHALTDNFFIRLEALHYMFGDRKSTASLTSDSDPGDFAVVEDLTTARVGLTYRFATIAN